MQQEDAHNIFNNGAVHVLEDQCSTCIYRPGNLMHLNPGTVKDMVDATIEGGDGATIVCHQTLDKDQNAVCRGWLDSKVGQEDVTMRLAHAYGIVKEITP